MWDTHLHSEFSGDSTADPKDQVEAAIKLGLDGICFTEHHDPDYPKDPEGNDVCWIQKDFQGYRERILKLKYEYIDRIEILWGVELGLQPHLSAEFKRLTRELPFDFVIGSSHLAHGRDVYFPDYFEGRSEEEAYTEYFVSILENLSAIDPEIYDSYGHLDYVVRYGPNKNRNYSYRKYADLIDEILRKLIWLGKALEVNTAGFKYGLKHPHPTEDVIRRYRELGGEMITIGADAHKPEHIAYDFGRLPELLRSCGFRYYTVFRNRDPEFLSLP